MITAAQYYFPYLFNLDTFNKELAAFGLHSFIKYDKETKMPEELLLTREQMKDVLLLIPFGKTIMVHQDKLFYWETDTNLVDIVQVGLNDLGNDPWLLTARLDLSALVVGKNDFHTYLDIEFFVTYARKDSIGYQQEAYEKFTIVIIREGQVTIIPFDWFNKKNSEYEYTWPATARLDPVKGVLNGQGIRMPDFCIELDISLLQ